MWKLPMAIGVVVGIVFTAPAAYLLGDFTGTQETSRSGRLIAMLTEARTQRDAALRDLAAANLMADIQKTNAEYNAKAAADANERISDYEAELATRKDVAACALTPADIGRLRDYSRPGSPATGLAPK